MPLPLPNLDDRVWTELVDEGRALIPLYAPEWTDQNVHDPGITLTELFAWLAERDIYRLNRITERHKRKFLALVGLWPEPPRPAKTVVSFALKPGQFQAVLPAAVEVEGNDPFGRSTRFRLLQEVTVVDAELGAVQLRDSNGFHDLTRRWKQGEPLNPFGDDPLPGVEFYLGLSAAPPLKVPVSLFFTFVGPQAGEEERQRLIQESLLQEPSSRMAESPVPDETGAPVPGRLGGTAALCHHSVHTAWEFFSGQGDWQSLAGDGEEKDETRAFTLSGRVQFSLPAAMGAVHLGQVAAKLSYLRCRFIAGAYDQAPRLLHVALHGVVAEQAVPPEMGVEPLGTGSGMPWQQFSVSQKPVVESSFQLFSLENGQRRSWKQQRDLDASAPDDWHFLLDPTLGEVTFGDGQHGRVVPANMRVEATYLATRAEAGNVAAKTILQLSESSSNQVLRVDLNSVSVNNPLPATGGAPAETLTHAEGRAAESLERPTRAVTLADYEWLAKKTPGAQVARVAAKANLYPAFPGLKAPGIIAVLVVPYLPAARPVPSPGLLKKIATYLNRRRIVGTRVEVFGPAYREIAVQAKVQSLAARNAVTLGQRITAALNLFFHPLLGGPDGNGWPFGRDVFRSEVLQVMSETDGVDYVFSLELIADGGKPQCGNVCLGPAGLVAAGQHQIEVR